LAFGHAARRIGQALGRLFPTKSHQPFYEPDQSRFAELVSRIRGASLCWCGRCGSRLEAVVVGDGEQTRVVALGCEFCGVGIPVRGGLLMGGEPASATIH
jgi:hypothetical protein